MVDLCKATRHIRCLKTRDLTVFPIHFSRIKQLASPPAGEAGSACHSRTSGNPEHGGLMLLWHPLLHRNTGAGTKQLDCFLRRNDT